MTRKEVIAMIRRNKHSKKKAIVFIADFLMITKKEARKIYDEEFGH